MLRHVFLADTDFDPVMLLWGGPDDMRALADRLTRFADAPEPSPLTQDGVCAAVDGRAIWLVPSVDRLGLHAAAGGSEGGFHWRMDATLARHFAALSLEQKITVRLSLNEYPPDFMAKRS